MSELSANRLSSDSREGSIPEVKRGQNTQNSEQGSLGLAVPTLETVRSIRAAINMGDRLSNNRAQPSERVKRRALLVAVQYESDGRQDASHLPSTPNDILKIYEILVNRGYKASNIRILSEGFVKDHGSKPTKENLQLSLEWLVQGAQSGDYRYFHFSGHGVAFESTPEKGKEAIIIPDSLDLRKGDDTEIIPLNLSSSNEEGTTQDQRGIRVSSRRVALGKTTFYNEAILTLWESPSLEEKAFMTKRQYDDYNRMLDADLNALFSQLPAGCTLTTTLDCCHSGRMLNAGHKLAGSGFRGSWNGDSQNPELWRGNDDNSTVHSAGFRGRIVVAIQAKPPIAPNLAMGGIHQPMTLGRLINTMYNWFLPPQLYIQTGENMAHPNNNIEGETGPSVNIIPHPSTHVDNANNLSDVHRESNSSTSASPRFKYGHNVDMDLEPIGEALRNEELEMDRIQANLISWSGCHQRQKASDYRDNNGGYFTKAFVRAVKEISDTSIERYTNPSLGQVHALVDSYLHDDIVKNKRPVLQYCQLWTSLGSGNARAADEKLNHPFEI